MQSAAPAVFIAAPKEAPIPPTDDERAAEPKEPSLQTLTLVEWSDSSPDEPGPRGPSLAFGSYEKRYRVEQFIGEGGMGRVYLGRDAVLERPVAIKYSRDDANEKARARFWYEALNSGKLDHPCIPPVHDVGIDSSGRPFYVMRLIRGTSLRELLARGADDDERWGLTRLLTVFVQVCGAVQFAHEEDILHLDIKPDNILVGTYGDVYLVDWGLSKQLDAPSPERTVQGSPAYMSPEQATGETRLTTATDVFALGVVLYELTTGQRPFTADRVPDLLKQVRNEPFAQGEAWRRCPGELQSLIADALQKKPEDRPRSAALLAGRVQEFLDERQQRQRRRQDVERLHRQAEIEIAEHDRLRQKERELTEEYASIQVVEWAGAPEKQALWQCEDARIRCRHEAEAAMERALGNLLNAYELDPNDLKTRRALGTVYWHRFEIAEASDDKFQQLYLETQLSRLKLENIDRLLIGEGRLSLRCAPKPTQITLESLIEVDRVLHPVQPVTLTIDELDHYPIAMGRYQISLSRNGYEPIVAPIAIARCQDVELDWRLRNRDEIGDGFVQIPPGPFVMGGDDRTFKSHRRSEQLVDEFAIARYPVTWSEYREFLQHLADRSRDEAKRRLPAVSTKDPDAWFIDEDGQVLWKQREPFDHGDWPIFMVTFDDALDYLAWRSERDGRRYRLPTDAEWEKAARGVDGRWFPWGDRFDASFCKNSKSAPGPAQPERVGRYAADCSPYGVRDMAGGIREWCESWFDEEDQQRLVRGGSWNFSSIGAHCAYRLGCAPNEAYVFIGFRLVHDLEEHGSTT